MSREPRGPDAQRSGMIQGDLRSCWLCNRAVSVRALFCHSCGALLPPADLDHFARLGLPRRFDLDQEVLERQYAGFRRAMDPARFTAKGTRQRAHATRHSELLTGAYDTLRDPLRRARYLIELSGAAQELAAAAAQPAVQPVLVELRDGLSRARDVTAMDHIAHQAARTIEAAIQQLAGAFRGNDLKLAAALVIRIERLEALAAEARVRRGGPFLPTPHTR